MLNSFKGLTLFTIALVCRLPFLWAGYGKEFDAWSNALNARIISETGVYEVSRLPGHPLQEMLLSLLYPINHSYFVYNFLSALISALAVWAFYEILKLHRIPKAWYWALSFNFIPVFFIAGTYTIDYNFALAFILLAYRSLLLKQYVLAGLLIGLATGFRISSLGFALPFALMLGWRNWRPILRMGIVALLISALAYSLPFSEYGLAFLDFHKPPFPGWASVLYKLGLGILGLPLLIYFFISVPDFFRRKAQHFSPDHLQAINLPSFLILVIAMQLAVFMRLPFKAEFFIPAVPFILLFWATYTQESKARWIAYVSLFSLLFFGFDYKDEWRGARPTVGSMEFEAGGKTIYCSPLQGPLLIDQGKRKVRSQTVERSILALQDEVPALVIAGWYWPELVFKYRESQHIIDHYSSEEELDSARAAGLRILYLPEIGQQNVLMEGHSKAEEWGEALLEP